MRISAIVRHVTGIDVPADTLERAVRRRMHQLDMVDRNAYTRLLAGGELDALVDLVVVPESWMFRDPTAFTVAADFAAQRHAERPGREVRILSVPCAGGEEPYSMAMALDRLGMPAGGFSIEGIDVSHGALARARAGRYTRNAFRGGDLGFRDTYFTELDGEYQLSETIRSRVAFSQRNLLAMSEPPVPYDIVFCRNLLIYLDPPTVRRAIAVLRALLADDGLLLAGYAEVPAIAAHGFVPLPAAGAFALRKQASAEPRKPARTALAVRSPSRPAMRSAPPESARYPAPAPAPASAPAPAPATAPALTDALLARAQRQANEGDYESAARSCHERLARQPDDAQAWFILGLIHDAQGDTLAAADQWRRCLYLDPDHYEALCSLALMSEQSGKPGQGSVLRQRAARVYRRGGTGSDET